MSEIDKGIPVSYRHKGEKACGEIIKYPQETTDSVYHIEDYLLDKTIEIPAGTLISEVQQNEVFRVFVVQQKQEDWIDKKKFRKKDNAAELKSSLSKARIISEELRL